MKPSNHYTVKARIWIESNQAAFVGFGRIQLLENIKKTGSITNAAKEMNMSYRKAWELVKKMNEHATTPLVEKIIGGKNGSGATLSEEGEKVIQKFYEIENEIQEYLKSQYEHIDF